MKFADTWHISEMEVWEEDYFKLPLAVTEYLQSGRVDDKMERAVVTSGKARNLDIAITPGERRVVRRLQRQVHQDDQRSDEAFK